MSTFMYYLNDIVLMDLEGLSSRLSHNASFHVNWICTN